MSGVKTIAAGENYSLFLKTDGTVWGTGFNGDGQLGDGTRNNRLAPVQLMSDVKAIAAGSASSFFVKTDGTVWASGFDYFGNLGDGNTTVYEQITPVQVLVSGVQAVAAGHGHTLFLKTDGTVWAVGDNYQGQLGNGTNQNTQYTPIQVMSGVKAVTTGSDYSLFIKNFKHEVHSNY